MKDGWLCLNYSPPAESGSRSLRVITENVGKPASHLGADLDPTRSSRTHPS